MYLMLPTLSAARRPFGFCDAPARSEPDPRPYSRDPIRARHRAAVLRAPRGASLSPTSGARAAGRCSPSGGWVPPASRLR